MQTRKKSLPDEKKLKRYHCLGRKYNTFHFGEKTSKNIKYGVVASTFHAHAIIKHSLIRYQNTHKKGYFSVNFIGSFVNLVMSNILDILPLACLRLIVLISWGRNHFSDKIVAKDNDLHF